MSLTCTVAGVARTDWAKKADTLEIDWPTNDPPTLALTFLDPDSLAGYRPAFRDEIVVNDGATALFGGVITETGEEGPGYLLSSPIRASGFAIFLSWCSVTYSVAAGQTTLQVLTYLVTNYLARYGITLDPAQAAGATLPEINWSRKLLREALADLGSWNNGWTVNVTPGKVLSLAAPGTNPDGTAKAAPSNITNLNAPTIIKGDVVVRSRADAFADRVILACGGSGQATKTQSPWAGSAGIVDGDYIYFYVEYPGQDDVGGYWPNSWSLSSLWGGAWVPCGWYSGVMPPPGAAMWDHGGGPSRAPGRIIYNWTLYGAVGAGDVIRLKSPAGEDAYVCQFPFVVTSDALAAAPVELNLDAPDVVDVTAGQAMADGIRASRTLTREVSYPTYTDGFRPGQAQTITLSRRNLSAATCLLTRVQMRLTGQVKTYSVTAVVGSTYPGSGLDFFKALTGGGGSGTVNGAATVVYGAQTFSIPLGGSTRDLMPGQAVPAMTEIQNAAHFEFGRPEHQGMTATVRAYIRARSGGVSVSVQLYDDAGVAVGSATTPEASTTWTLVTVTVAVPASIKNCHLRSVAGAANEDHWVAPGILLFTL